MSLELILLVLLAAVVVPGLWVLWHRWRWRGSQARPPMPGSSRIAGLAARFRRAPGSSGATEPAGGQRIVRPRRLVVSGAALAALPRPADELPPDPRRRLMRDAAVVLMLGSALVLAVVALPQALGPTEGVLGATSAPGDPGPGATLAPGPSEGSSSPTPDASVDPGTSPSMGPSPTAEASAGPTPTATPAATPRPTSRPTSRPTPRPTARPTSAPTAPPSPEPSTEPSPEPSTEPTPSTDLPPSP